MFLRRRARGVPRLRRGDARQLHVPRRHLRHARGRAPRDRRSAASCARAATSSPASGSTPATSRTCRSRRASCSTPPGFPDAKIVASNDLDEHLIASAQRAGRADRRRGASARSSSPRYDQPALGGVYKLGAVARRGRRLAATRSSFASSRSRSRTPASCRSAGCAADGEFVGDVIYDERARPRGPALHDIEDPLRRRRSCPSERPGEDLLVPVSRARPASSARPTLEAASRARRRRARAALAAHAPVPEPAAVPGRARRSVHSRKRELVAEGAPPRAGEGDPMTSTLVFSTQRYDYLGDASPRPAGWERRARSTSQDVPRRRALPADRHADPPIAT